MPPDTTVPRSSGDLADRLRSVDILRGVAILAVVLTHLPFSVRGWSAGGEAPAIFPPPPFTLFTDYGRYGVQLFLVISGFCIHMRWSREADVDRHVPFLPFWKRRLMRLYPPYLVALLLSLLAVWVLHSFILGPEAPGLPGLFGYQDPVVFTVDMALLFLMMQNLTPAPWRIGNSAVWSLALEEQLYLLYFPFLFMRRRHGWVLPLTIVFLLTLCWRVAGLLLFNPMPFFWYLVGPAFWFPWVLGALAVEAYHGHIVLPPWTRSWTVAAALLFAGILADPPDGSLMPATALGVVLDDLLFCAAFFVVINRLVSLERSGALARSWASDNLARLGVWSYSIYLVHLLVMVALKQLGVQAGWPLGLILGARALVGISAGYLFFRLVERWFHQRARLIQVG